MKKTKNYNTGIILSLFLGHLAWIYTYRDNNWKFWICMILNLALWWTIIIPITTHTWAFLDHALADKQYFHNYWKTQ